MLVKHFGEAWRARERAVAISPALSFAPDGLVLGAGTVLVPAKGERQLTSLDGQETRVLALLTAAYQRPVPPAVLGNIARAAKCWASGEDALAAIHLALTGLNAMPAPREGACLLFAADELLKRGASPRAIFEALGIERPFIDALEKLYDPAQPRVPMGSGETSGQWTRILSFLGDLKPGQVAQLGRFALGVLGRAGGAAAAFGLLFIPSPNNLQVEGEVPGLPRSRYSWNRDELSLQLTYEGKDGKQQTLYTRKDAEGVFRDESGKAVGRALPDGTVAFDLQALPSATTKGDEPRLCPQSVPDKKSGERGWDYQWHVAKIVNPDNPTLYSFGYELLKPDGTPVSFDDCRQSNGGMVEDKGPVYAKLLKERFGPESLGKKWLDQSARQLEAAGERELTWYFAEQEAADFAKALFAREKGGRQFIHIEVKEWPEKKQ